MDQHYICIKQCFEQGNVWNGSKTLYTLIIPYTENNCMCMKLLKDSGVHKGYYSPSGYSEDSSEWYMTFDFEPITPIEASREDGSKRLFYPNFQFNEQLIQALIKRAKEIKKEDMCIRINKNYHTVDFQWFNVSNNQINSGFHVINIPYVN
jgi:hypothetical protein